MSDSHDPGPLPELTPEQESDVRRLLAEARHDEPIPADVADRLDTVLAGLSRDEPGAPGLAPVIDLAARRRRRNAAAVLAGAAAVIVAGFGIGQVIDVGSDDAGSGSSTVADRAGASSVEKGQDSSESPEGGSSGGDTAVSPDVVPQPASPYVLTLRSKHLESDLTDQLSTYPSSANGSAAPLRGPEAATFDAVGCTFPAPPNKFGVGALFPALYDGTPAVLALRPPADGTQQADVLQCGTAQLLASASLAAR